MGDRVTYLGYANARAKRRRFGIKQKDRFSHIHIIGKTGTGKSTLLEQMVLQDVMARDCAVILIDPHGDLARGVSEKVPQEDRERVVFLDGARPDFSFNPLAGITEAHQPLAVAALISVFARQWEDSWGPRVEHLLRNCLYVLVAQQTATLADLPRLLTDKALQRTLLAKVTNGPVRDFFLREWPRYSLAFKGSMQAPLLNKLGGILADPRLQELFCGEGRLLRLSSIMKEQGIFLVDLSKGRLGEGPAGILGAILLAYTAVAGLARSGAPPTFVFVDELGSVATSFVASMLEELRKRSVGLTVAHQHLSQVDPEIRDAVLGNAGTRMLFRVGAKDAPFFGREFGPKLTPGDIMNLPNYAFYSKLLIEGEPSRPFSGETAASLRSLQVRR